MGRGVAYQMAAHPHDRVVRAFLSALSRVEADHSYSNRVRLGREWRAVARACKAAARQYSLPS